MSDLIDYSGKFDPKFSFDKFSKETLLKVLKAYCEYMRHIDSFWYLTVADKWGNDEAIDCDIRAWEKSKAYEVRTLSNLLNIHGDDVATLMKLIQVSPWAWIQDRVIDIKDNNHAVVTVRACPILFAIEKEEKGREMEQCHVACSKIIGFNASYFNPKIKVTPLKLPPRKSKNDICCQREFKLER